MELVLNETNLLQNSQLLIFSPAAEFFIAAIFTSWQPLANMSVTRPLTLNVRKFARLTARAKSKNHAPEAVRVDATLDAGEVASVENEKYWI